VSFPSSPTVKTMASGICASTPGRAPAGMHLAERDDLVALLDQPVNLEAEAIEALVQLFERLPHTVVPLLRHASHVASIRNPLNLSSEQRDDRLGAFSVVGLKPRNRSTFSCGIAYSDSPTASRASARFGKSCTRVIWPSANATICASVSTWTSPLAFPRPWISKTTSTARRGQGPQAGWSGDRRRGRADHATKAASRRGLESRRLRLRSSG
jgi:hypothetical protein